MSDARQVAADLRRLSDTTAARVAATTARYGLMLEADVKRRASRSRTLPSVPGLPPRLQTGDYNRSIGTRHTVHATTARAEVGTNAEQGARLEFGHDDGRSRTWPHPHFGPALDKIGDLFEAAIARLTQPPKGKG